MIGFEKAERIVGGLVTLTTPDRESCDLALIYPGNMQYRDYRDHSLCR